MCKDFPAWDKQIYTSENQKKLYPGALSWNTEPVLTQHYRHPHQESSVHRQLGLFVVVFREEIHRKQDFMVAKSALNFFSLFFFLSLFLSKKSCILDFLLSVHLYVLGGKNRII